ncbi:uncharacterized protein LOC134268128 [Saccostrea cucullata]|uniref:uncharacterized protein LOC134268128 n=1 Tax=Saccostrea cuccullata TaxID=36930 RepID=UPI002ECFBDA0
MATSMWNISKQLHTDVGCGHTSKVINLCKACVGEHLSDSSKRHKVVPYKHRKPTHYVNYPKCPNHTQKHCELYCEKCDIPVCSTCISSEIAFNIKTEKADLEKHCEKLTTVVSNQGEAWQSEIDIIVKKRKCDIAQIKTRVLKALDEKENEINQMISELEENITYLKEILGSDDESLIFTYISRNAGFRRPPPKININTEQLHQMFGSLSALFITTEEHGYTMKTQEAEYCPLLKPLLDEPELITTIDTGYKTPHSVTCIDDEEIWTSGQDKIMKLYNLQGKLRKSIKTKSRSIDMAVTRSGGSSLY